MKPCAAPLALALLLPTLAAAPATTPAPSAPSYHLLTPADPTSNTLTVATVSADLRSRFRIPDFYKNAVILRGIPIIGSEKVSTYAFLECANQLDHLLHDRPIVLDALTRCRVRVGIIACTEYTMDLPENQNARMIARGAYNDRRSRGLGGLPLATCAEENLLSLRGDPYARENITIHEFSHTVASAMRQIHPEWYARLRDAYQQAMAAHLYGDSYAATNEQEYWAEGAQCWFDAANRNNAGGAATRDQLKAKDAPLAALLNEIYGDGPWRFTKATSPRRPEEERHHLTGFNPANYPIFSFDNSPRIRAAASQPTDRRP